MHITIQRERGGGRGREGGRERGRGGGGEGEKERGRGKGGRERGEGGREGGGRDGEGEQHTCTLLSSFQKSTIKYTFTCN